MSTASAISSNHQDLKRRRDLLTSIPGIGKATAGSILSEIPHLDRFQSAKAVAAFAGLSPRERRSGTSINGRPRLCKTGNARVRKALYMPAIVALRFNPVLRVFADRLLAAGKAQASRHRSRHAQTVSSRLWHSSVWHRF